MVKKKLVYLLVINMLLLLLLPIITACNSFSITNDVIFMVDGEELCHKTVNVTNGDNMPDKPEKDGYLFVGWFVDEALTTEYNTEYVSKTVISGTLTVYAKWKEHTEIMYTMDDKDSSYLYFGSYPQTIADNNAVLAMSAEAGEDGYYTSSYDNAKYAKVVSTPHSKGYKFSTNDVIVQGKAYFYKVEPIKWRILNDEGGVLLIEAVSILDNLAYQSEIKFDEESVAYYNSTKGTAEDTYANDWENSEIRKWLNDAFYKRTFSKKEQEIIKNTELNNKSVGANENDFTLAQEATTDKVFLLSYKDMINPYYGFSTIPEKFDNNRNHTTSDYVRSKGLWMNTDSTCYGNGIYWLRTAGKSSTAVSNCNDYAAIGEGNVTISYYGVLPVLSIEKAEEELPEE